MRISHNRSAPITARSPVALNGLEYAVMCLSLAHSRSTPSIACSVALDSLAVNRAECAYSSQPVNPHTACYNVLLSHLKQITVVMLRLIRQPSLIMDSAGLKALVRLYPSVVKIVVSMPILAAIPYILHLLRNPF